jgi:hypothetical protein
MKALSIKPPWSTMIVAGIKPIENRNWYSKYRGRLYIHSSKTWDKEGAKWICENYPHFKGFINHSKHLRGFLIGHVEMVDCVNRHNSPWFFGPWGFVFENPIEFSHESVIPFKGRLGIFEIII